MGAALITGKSGGSTGSLLSGDGPPANSLGKDKDFYINSTNPSIYGPKTNGVWPVPIPFGGATLVSKMDSTGLIAVSSQTSQSIVLPVIPNYAEVYLNGIMQDGNCFFFQNNVITINTGSINARIGDFLEVTYEVVGSSDNTTGTVPIEETPNGLVNGTNKIFTISYSPNLNTLNVFVNGLRVSKTSFSVNNLQLTFNTAPSANSTIITTYYR